jgi:DNA polymerase-3 subunit delta'
VSPAAAGVREPAQHNLSSLAGHELVKRYLLGALDLESLPHALLFHGPRGVGKASMAYALAKAANCPGRATAPCSCNACRKIAEGIFADMVTVEPRGAAGQITLAGWKTGKDDQEGPQYYRFVDSRPLEGSRKVLIIRQAERMNIALANHLLKLIEEPPSYLLMVLLTHRPGELLRTIRSRCAPVRFGVLDTAELERFARDSGLGPVDEPQMRSLFRLCEGRPGLLLELMGEASAAQRAETARSMAAFQQHGFLALFRVAADLARGAAPAARFGAAASENFEGTLVALLAWLRDAVLVKTLPPARARELVLNADLLGDLERYAATAPVEGLVEAFDAVREAFVYAPRQTDKAYVMEALLMRIGRAMRRRA